jgi:hypothetical protein
MSADPSSVIASLGVVPTYSAREACAMLGRSYSWVDQRLRAGEFVRPDGTPVTPLRTPGGYRRFTLTMLQDIAVSSANRGWFSHDELRCSLRELLIAAHHQTGKYEIPSDASGPNTAKNHQATR